MVLVRIRALPGGRRCLPVLRSRAELRESRSPFPRGKRLGGQQEGAGGDGVFAKEGEAHRRSGEEGIHEEAGERLVHCLAQRFAKQCQASSEDDAFGVD